MPNNTQTEQTVPWTPVARGILTAGLILATAPAAFGGMAAADGLGLSHPLPETDVTVTDCSDTGCVVEVSVSESHGWRYINIFQQSSGLFSDGGPGQTGVALTDGERSTYLSTQTPEGGPEEVPYGSSFAIQAFYDGARGVYYQHVVVTRWGLIVMDASELPDDHCWHERGGRCVTTDPVPNRLVTPPEASDDQERES